MSSGRGGGVKKNVGERGEGEGAEGEVVKVDYNKYANEYANVN